MSSTNVTNETVVRRLFDEVFNKGNFSVVDDLVASEFIEHQHQGRPGRDGLKQVAGTLRLWFSDFRMSIEDLVSAEDMVWCRLISQGTNTGSIMGHPPTGKTMRTTVFDSFRLVDGKIVEHWGVADTLGMMGQIGIAPAPRH